MPPPVEQLIARMKWAAERGLSELTITMDASRVTIRRGIGPEVVAAVVPSPIPQDEAAAAVGIQSPAPDFVTAPLAGLCHLSPEPGAAPFVSPGQKVGQGQTLCMIEAMKVMTQVTAPFSATVAAILVEDGASVEVGTPLVRLS